MRQPTVALALSVAALCAAPAVSFLPPVPSQRSAVARTSSRGWALASTEAEGDAAAPAVTSDAPQSRKAKSKEQVRQLLKGLGELDDDDGSAAPVSAKKKRREMSLEAKRAMKDKAKLAPEEVFFEGGPHWSEAVVPTVGILTVIGVFPWAASMARQIWVRYKITSRRISVVSGVGGKDLTEVIYQDIEGMNYVLRAFGATGDMVLFLRDGSKLEMRSVPDFRAVYNYIRDRLDTDAAERSPKLALEG